MQISAHVLTMNGRVIRLRNALTGSYFSHSLSFGGRLPDHIPCYLSGQTPLYVKMNGISAAVALLDLTDRLVELKNELLQLPPGSKSLDNQSPNLTSQEKTTKTTSVVPFQGNSCSLGPLDVMSIGKLTKSIVGTARDLQRLEHVLIGASAALLLLDGEQGVINSAAECLLQRCLELWDKLEHLLKSVKPSSGSSAIATRKLADQKAALSNELYFTRHFPVHISKHYCNEAQQTCGSVGKKQEVQTLTELLQNAVWEFRQVTHEYTRALP
jgi:hypothetical protein